MYFDGAVNRKGMGIGAVLESPSGEQLPASVKLQFNVPTIWQNIKHAS